jgi:hypothetical protein
MFCGFRIWNQENLVEKKEKSIDLVEKSKISRWIRCGFQESYEFGIRKTKWSEKS